MQERKYYFIKIKKILDFNKIQTTKLGIMLGKVRKM